MGSFELHPSAGLLQPDGSTVDATQSIAISETAVHPDTGEPPVTIRERQIILRPKADLIHGRTYTVYTTGGTGRRLLTQPAGLVEDLQGNPHMGLPQYVNYKFGTGYQKVSEVPENCEERKQYGELAPNETHQAYLQAMHEIEWTPECEYSKDAVEAHEQPCGMPLAIHEVLLLMDLVTAIILCGCVVLICWASLHHRWMGHSRKGRLPRRTTTCTQA